MQTRFHQGNRFSRLQSPDQLSSCTSDFRPIDARSLNVRYIDTEDLDDLLIPLATNVQRPRHLLIRNLNKDHILAADRFDELDDDERTVAEYLRRILLNELPGAETRESRTDTFVNLLLTDLRLNKYPFVLNLQPDYKFLVANKQITSKPEFTIEKNGAVLCLDEDKHIRNTTRVSGYGQNQIAGELIACAYTNFNSATSPTAGTNQTIFAVRVIGSRFTLFRCDITCGYLESLADGLPSEEQQLHLYQYPGTDVDSLGYDYADPSARTQVIEILLRLREQLKQL